MEKYISFDIGGTKVKHGLLSNDGTILSKDSYPTQCTDLGRFLEDMISTIEYYKNSHEISGVAISLPGYINTQTGYSESAGSVVALHNQNLKGLLEERIPLRVEMENDGNCAALAEKLNGHATNCTDFICMTIGTGIGGGIFVNGQIVRGHRFRGGEFGFMITRGGEENKMMHWNASTSSLIKAYKQLKGINEDVLVEGEEIFIQSLHDDEIKGIIDRWLQSLSYGIYNLAVTLNPQKILIGGGVSSREGLIQDIEYHLEQNEWWKGLSVPIECCKHKNDAGMIGALYHFLEQLNKEKSNTVNLC